MSKINKSNTIKEKNKKPVTSLGNHNFSIKVRDSSIGTFQNYENVYDIERYVDSLQKLHSDIKDRLKVHQDYEQMQPHQKLGASFTDENGEKRSAREALMPDDTIINFMNSFFYKINDYFSPEAAKAFLNKLEKNSSLKSVVKDLRDAFMIADEFVEKNMLERLFNMNISEKSPNELQKFKDKIYKSSELNKKYEDITTSDKLAILTELICDYSVKKAAQSYKNKNLFGNPYELQIIEEYDSMVRAEVDLLTHTKNGKPFIAKDDMKNKNFCFVGAGFPLSGILLNIHTGSKLTLIDMDKEACDNAIKFIDIMDKMGVIDKKDFTIIHGDALEFKYQTDSQEQQNSNNLQNSKVIYTDILQLAAALPKEVTEILMKESCQDLSFVMKRDVTGAATMLYDSASIEECGSFKLKEQAAPPQRIKAKTLLPNAPCTITMGENNINTTGLYVKPI